MLPRPFRVAAARRELADVVTLELAPADDGPPLYCEPGRFNMLYAFAVGEAPISMSGPGAASAGVLHTIRDVGAVTRALCGLAVGDTVGLRGPFGEPWPLDLARGGDVLIIAGGIGLAPVRPLLQAVLAGRSAFNRVCLLYGAREPGSLLFHEDLDSWARRDDLQCLVTVDHADGDWRGNVGVVPRLLSQAGFDPARTTAFVCGPEVMMRLTLKQLVAGGLRPDRAFLSLERNMVCGIGLCGHCQLGPAFVCRDGPVFSWQQMAAALAVPEL